MRVLVQQNLLLLLPVDVLQEHFAFGLRKLIDILNDVAVVVRVDQELAVLAKSKCAALRPAHRELLASDARFDVKLKKAEVQLQTVDAFDLPQ